MPPSLVTGGAIRGIPVYRRCRLISGEFLLFGNKNPPVLFVLGLGTKRWVGGTNRFRVCYAGFVPPSLQFAM